MTHCCWLGFRHLVLFCMHPTKSYQPISAAFNLLIPRTIISDFQKKLQNSILQLTFLINKTFYELGSLLFFLFQYNFLYLLKERKNEKEKQFSIVCDVCVYIHIYVCARIYIYIFVYVNCIACNCVIIFFNHDVGNEVIANWQEKCLLSYCIRISGEFTSLCLKVIDYVSFDMYCVVLLSIYFYRLELDLSF